MKTYTKNLFIPFFLFFTLTAVAQQQAQYSQYMINEFLVNPALSGVEDFADIKMGFRNQWVGIDDAPRTFYVSGHTSLGKQQGAMTHKGDYRNWHGAGGLFYSDRTGPISQNAGYLNYSYNLKITEGEGFNRFHKEGIRLSLGAFMGFNQFSIDGSMLNPEEQDDVAITSGIKNTMVPDASLGAMLYFRDQYFIGLSTFQVLGSRIRFNGLSSSALDNAVDEDSRLFRHYYFSFAYKKEIQPDFYLIPSALVKFVSPAPASIDFNLWLDYKDIFFGGFSYRTSDAVAAMIGVVLDKRYELYYSYDLTVSELSIASRGAHEITVGWRILPSLTQRNHSDFR